MYTNFLLRIPEGKRLLGGLKCRWINNIRMDPRGIRWDIAIRDIQGYIFAPPIPT
jgi:hypothetical protein